MVLQMQGGPVATDSSVSRGQSIVLWSAFALYVAGRIGQQYPDKIGVLTIVAMQVVAPAVFALVHGSILYRVKGMLAFSGFCMGIGAICECLSLRTGFPFGNYFFTDLMGPKILDVPVLLVLAYLGIGYCSWVLGVVLLGYRNKLLTRTGIFALACVAAFIMMAWDLSMDSIWSTLDRAWIWRDGGMYFGVPLSNFVGWYFTAFLFYLVFAIYCRKVSLQRQIAGSGFWRVAILFYAVCAGGNLLVFRSGLFPVSAIDATGRLWMARDILIASVLVSLLVMAPLAVLAWLRLNAQEAEEPAECPDAVTQ
jgi:putative membrane protein